MLRMTRSLAVLILAGAIGPVAANAALFGKSVNQSGASQTKQERIKFVLVNKSDVSKNITLEGRSYTLTPHQELAVSALPGSQITETDPDGAKTEKVLFTVDRMHKGVTVTLN